MLMGVPGSVGMRVFVLVTVVDGDFMVIVQVLFETVQCSHRPRAQEEDIEACQDLSHPTLPDHRGQT